MTIHVVRSGETLNAIAAQYGVNPAQLGAANDVPAGGALAVGQTRHRHPRPLAEQLVPERMRRPDGGTASDNLLF